jgi:ribosomal protein S18 acetylase RimI-like enzyme
MTFSVRRLGPQDLALLETLARDDADFDIPGRGRPHEPLTPDAARAYLADPAVLHWVAESAGEVVGHMYCHVLRKHSDDPTEVLLYEIGVRSAHRRRGVGRALVEALDVWMKDHHIRDSWVLADNPGAVEFYRACGFEIEEPAPVYLVHTGGGGG